MPAGKAVRTEIRVKLHVWIALDVPVPHGTYTMDKLSIGRYRFGEGLPEFELNLREVSNYFRGQMEVIDGRFP